jgi:hypothetical protein
LWDHRIREDAMQPWHPTQACVCCFIIWRRIRPSWKLATLSDTRGELLVVCGTNASGDDYDDIVNYKTHLPLLRRFAEFHHGIRCAEWLRTVMNRSMRICTTRAFRPG